MMNSQELTQEQIQHLTGLAEEAERELALGVQSQSNRAFNLGCTLWFIPGAVAVAAAFLLSKGNWVITAFLAVLVGVFAAGFAIVSAYNTKKKATDRLYQEMTLPQIDLALSESQLNLAEFKSNCPTRRCRQTHFCTSCWTIKTRLTGQPQILRTGNRIHERT